MVNQTCAFSQSELWKYFEWIIRLINFFSSPLIFIHLITLSIIISCKQYKNNHSVLNNRLPNNTQITSRPLRFIEGQRSLINRTVTNTSQEWHQGKLTQFWMRIYKRHSEARKNPYKKPARDGKKNIGKLGRNQAQKTPRPSYEAEKLTIIKRKYIHHIYR